MTRIERPHLFGLDDGPFDARTSPSVAIVGVVTEGADLVEGVAVTHFPPDGPEVTDFLARWIGGLRVRPALHGIIIGGITIAGLAVIDLGALASATGVPVMAVHRRDPRQHRLAAALRAAGLADRLAIVERAPPPFRLPDGLFVTCAGVGAERAARLLGAARLKADLPEPLRLAHMIARAVTTGESHGRA